MTRASCIALVLLSACGGGESVPAATAYAAAQLGCVEAFGAVDTIDACRRGVRGVWCVEYPDSGVCDRLAPTDGGGQ
jgi:hypothetical protein